MLAMPLTQRSVGHVVGLLCWADLMARLTALVRCTALVIGL